MLDTPLADTPASGSDPSRHDQPDQRIARVRDARVGQHALHVGLHDGYEVPQDQGQDAHAQDEPAPVRFHAPEAFEHHPEERPETRGFGGHGHERGHRGRRALVHVRGPHVERHRRHLEAEPHDHQHQGDEDQRVVESTRIDRRGDFDQARAARGAEDEGNAVKQEARRERAQDEILGRRFDGPGFKPLEARQDVERDGHQLDAEIDDQEVGAGDHDHHAGQGKQHEPVEFGQVDPLFLEVPDGEQDRHAAHDVEQQFPERGIPVHHHEVAERKHPVAHAAGRHDETYRERGDAHPRQQVFPVRRGDRVQDQQETGHAHDDQLREDRDQVCERNRHRVSGSMEFTLTLAPGSRSGAGSLP